MYDIVIIRTVIWADTREDYIMDREYEKILQKTLDYIDEHIMEKITIDELAVKSGFSKYHFHRLFNKIVKLPVMEYVTKRKLQFALYDLSKGDKVLDIAIKYGFETHAGFTKAFKKCFGYPPKFYRIHAPIDYPKRVELGRLYDNKTGGVIMQPRIIHRDSFKIVGYDFKTTLKNNAHSRDVPAFWDQCNIEGKELRLYRTQEPIKHGEYGICIHTSTEKDQFSYVLGLEVPDFSNLKEDMYKLEVPSAEYAVFTTPPVEEQKFARSIQGTWKHILDEWFPNSSYEIDDQRLDFEFYDERCHHWDHEKVCMEIHIPIKVK